MIKAEWTNADTLDLQPTCNQLATDCISRQAAKDRLTILVNEIEGIFADIRERNVDDSVCGLCEYDCDHGIDGSAFECPGFERDDCFKLKDEYKEEWTDVKALPSVQPEIIKCRDCIMHGVCRFEIGLGENGFCSQGKRGNEDE